jgi:hypothetical protein
MLSQRVVVESKSRKATAREGLYESEIARSVEGEDSTFQELSRAGEEIWRLVMSQKDDFAVAKVPRARVQSKEVCREKNEEMGEAEVEYRR